MKKYYIGVVGHSMSKISRVAVLAILSVPLVAFIMLTEHNSIKEHQKADRRMQELTVG